MKKKWLYLALLILFLADSGYSFLQHYHLPLDGDLPSCVIPRSDIQPVLDSPLGLRVFSAEQPYLNPNRFFSHWSVYHYFHRVPLFLQQWTDPINSVYLSAAIVKIIVQIGLILLLAGGITGSFKVTSLSFMGAVVLITPFFQTNGYRGQMAIIDPAATYTFFYALPAALLLLYLLPMVRVLYHGRKGERAKRWGRVFWIPLALIVCLSGPLNPGIILVISLLVLINYVQKSDQLADGSLFSERIVQWIRSIPSHVRFHLLPLIFLALYSLFIGRYNAMEGTEQPALAALYTLLPKGVYYQFTQKLGFPLLFMMLSLNTILITRKYRTPDGEKILRLFKWFGLFALIYILLLPLGGYRSYRALILRYDTILPITLGLVFIYGASTLFLLKHLPPRQKNWYLPLVVGILLLYSYADEPDFDQNDCERMALSEIATSSEEVIELQVDCTVLSWERIQAPENSELQARLLEIWRITDRKKRYYTPPKPMPK